MKRIINGIEIWNYPVNVLLTKDENEYVQWFMREDECSVDEALQALLRQQIADDIAFYNKYESTKKN